MSMTRQAKQQAVTDLSERLSRAKAALVANFTGLDVASVTEIRRAFRDAGVEYKVVKNTLMKRALTGTSVESLGEAFTGPTAIAFKYDDEFGRMGKTAKELSKKFEKFQIKAGFIEGDVLKGATAVDTMAALPTMDEARAQLIATVVAPATQFLSLLNAPASQFLSVLQAKADKDAEAAA